MTNFDRSSFIVYKWHEEVSARQINLSQHEKKKQACGF